MDYDTETGPRVARLRVKAGLNQTELGRRVRRSQSWVAHVESNRIVLDSMAIILELANALNCQPNDITGRPYPAASVTEGRALTAALPEVRRQLGRYDLASDWNGPLGALDELEAALDKVTVLRKAARYVTVAQELVTLLPQTQAAAEEASGNEKAERANMLYVRACYEAHSTGHNLGFADLPILAQRAAEHASVSSGHPALPAWVAYMRSRDMWTSASWADAGVVMDRALQHLEHNFASEDRIAIEGIGMLQLRAAINSARAGDGDEAWTRYELAQDADRRLGEGPRHDFFRSIFTTGNVAIHGVAVAVELMDPVAALDRGKGLRVPADMPASRAGHHWMDMGRAYLWYGNVDRALAALEKAERTAPLLVRNHPMARRLVRQLMDRRTRMYDEKLRRLADRLHAL